MATTKQSPKPRGRPRLDGTLDTVPVTVRMTPPQKEKLSLLGGSAWVRARIDKARAPTGGKS